MDFLAGNERLSFRYDGTPFAELKKETRTAENAGDYTVEYLLPDGMKVTNVAHRYAPFGAYEWVTSFENTADGDSGVISELYDCDIRIPFEYDRPMPSQGFVPPAEVARVYNPVGSILSRTEFSCSPQPIMPGDSKHFATNGGRSSQQNAPFFDVCREGRGVLFAIGWTGQWCCEISRNNAAIHIQTGIEDVNFRLHPKEKIRTSSIVVMPYEGGQDEAHNRFRRLIKKHFSLIGKEGRGQYGPLSHMFWGSRSSDKMIGIIKKLKEHELGYEYIWIDAGWYGYSSMPCPNEFEGDWGKHTGNWNVNKNYHPDGLKEVSRVIGECGMKLLLWVEPERCVKTSDIARQHPEWFFQREGDSWLLNLGNEKALQYVIELISNLVRELHISCYRQDFNIDPLPFWRGNDEPDRAGISEIKHIMGLYRFWDTLLERFPHLIIDNCASGGRRIDIETLRRSMPMWRSDYQCPWNCDPETTQTHETSISWWIPYSGTGAGNVLGDTYRSRSCYAPSLTMNYWGYEGWEFDETQAGWAKERNEEYKRVRPYLSCDYYPLILSPLDDSNWCASQYNRPENNDGIVIAFRRPLSICDRAQLELKGLDKGKVYVFTDADTGETFEIPGAELCTQPLGIELPEKRSSKLMFYRAKF